MIIGPNFYTAVGLLGTLAFMLLGLFSTYPAVRAYEKGRNFAKWYIFSFFLFPIALVASIVINDKKEMLS
ncbi:hypothetical protein [Mahella sp.]|jgi:hypothetical protein|uniref:hypothetical protein n=1 Tax=Mahella sp. TaxID=2798721 RepID=UPI0024AB78A0|nr:hypothetical protein [Mahella sp.]MBZ4666483.1 hypothetical protein [Mahella sp.]MDI3508344.1 hypothetical protein [Clostridiales bacterium]MDK2902626.1 hypothetical protein [Clostridiales bacterium]MDK2991183.1 hypothetical protein [Clostridiales bacterium]